MCGYAAYGVLFRGVPVLVVEAEDARCGLVFSYVFVVIPSQVDLKEKQVFVEHVYMY